MNKQKILNASRRRIYASLCMVVLCALIAGCTATDTQPTKPWEVSEEVQQQIKTEYANYLAQYFNKCTAEDMKLTVVTQVKDIYVVFIECACSSNMDNPDAFDNLMQHYINKLQFFIPANWTLLCCKDANFNSLEGAYNSGWITDEQLATIWEDYYDRFPAAWEFWKTRNPEGAPTLEEQQMLEQYRNIVTFLENHDPRDVRAGGAVHGDGTYYQGAEAVKFCYKKLQEMEEVDQWIDYCKQNYEGEYSWDRQVYLSRFSVLEDRLQYGFFYQSLDGEKFSRSESQQLDYDDQGRVICVDIGLQVNFRMQMYLPRDFQSGSNYVLFYDETGRVYRIEGQHGYYTYTPNYDASGKITDMLVQCGTDICYIQYTYDAQGRLIRVDSPDYVTAKKNQNIVYTYDSKGNLIRKEETAYDKKASDSGQASLSVSNLRITEYVYDANGRLVEASYTEQKWEYGTLLHQSQDAYTFTYDDRDRLKQYDIIHGDTYFMSGVQAGQVFEAPYKSSYMKYVYNDYYVYTAP